MSLFDLGEELCSIIECGMLPFTRQLMGFKNAGLLETVKQMKKDLVKTKLLNKKLIANIDEYLLSL